MFYVHFPDFNAIFASGGKEKRYKIIWTFVALLVCTYNKRSIYLQNENSFNRRWGINFL